MREIHKLSKPFPFRPSVRTEHQCENSRELEGWKEGSVVKPLQMTQVWCPEPTSSCSPVIPAPEDLTPPSFWPLWRYARVRTHTLFVKKEYLKTSGLRKLNLFSTMNVANVGCGSGTTPHKQNEEFGVRSQDSEQPPFPNYGTLGRLLTF